MHPQSSDFIKHLFIWCMAVLTLGGCALTAPVQEMSNARQTIQAAKDAKADVHAPQEFAEAQRLLDIATDALASGDYSNAREHALEAKQQAIKAMQHALSAQKGAGVKGSSER